MDGASFITQCPISPKTSFEYEFNAADPGTHMWHAHAGTQRGDGFFGALIVREYDTANKQISMYDQDLVEHVILINDWLNETSISNFVKTYHDDFDHRPHAMLINGRGVWPYAPADSPIPNTPRAIFSVQPGVKYRFRLVNAGFLYCPIEFSIDNHTLTVITTDGNPIEPYEVVSVVMQAGERFDFVLNANQSNTSASFWIRAKGLAHCAVRSVYQTAILSYTTNSTLGVDYDNITFPSDPSLLDYKTMNRSGRVM